MPASVLTFTSPMYVGPTASSSASGARYRPGDFKTKTSTLVIFIRETRLLRRLQTVSGPSGKPPSRNARSGRRRDGLESRGVARNDRRNRADTLTVGPLPRPRPGPRAAPKCRREDRAGSPPDRELEPAFGAVAVWQWQKRVKTATHSGASRSANPRTR